MFRVIVVAVFIAYAPIAVAIKCELEPEELRAKLRAHVESADLVAFGFRNIRTTDHRYLGLNSLASIQRVWKGEVSEEVVLFRHMPTFYGARDGADLIIARGPLPDGRYESVWFLCGEKMNPAEVVEVLDARFGPANLPRGDFSDLTAAMFVGFSLMAAAGAAVFSHKLPGLLTQRA